MPMQASSKSSGPKKMFSPCDPFSVTKPKFAMLNMREN